MEPWGRVFEPSLPRDIVPLPNKDLMRNRIPAIEISSLQCFFWGLCIILYGNCIQKVKVVFSEKFINKLGARHELKGQLCYFTYGILSCWAFLASVCFSHFICVSHQTTTLRNTAGFMRVYYLISFVKKYLFSTYGLPPGQGGRAGSCLSHLCCLSMFIHLKTSWEELQREFRFGVIEKETSRF